MMTHKATCHKATTAITGAPPSWPHVVLITLMTLSNPNYSSKSPLPNTINMWFCGLFLHMNSGEHTYVMECLRMLRMNWLAGWTLGSPSGVGDVERSQEVPQGSAMGVPPWGKMDLWIFTDFNTVGVLVFCQLLGLNNLHRLNIGSGYRSGAVFAEHCGCLILLSGGCGDGLGHCHGHHLYPHHHL